MPVAFQDELCPRPGQDVFDAMEDKNKDKNKKAKERREAKKKRKQDAINEGETAPQPNQIAAMGDSTQNVETQNDRPGPIDLMTLDSVRQTLNPETPPKQVLAVLNYYIIP